MARQPRSGRRLDSPSEGQSVTERSAQHGPRIDEAMQDELQGLVRGAPAETRAREDLEPEPTEVPVAGASPGDEEHRQVVQRSELARFLRPSAFPGRADTLLAVAREEQAPDAVLDQLESLPRGPVYATLGEIWETLGHDIERRDHAAPPDAESAEPEAPKSSTAGESEPVPTLAERREPFGPTGAGESSAPSPLDAGRTLAVAAVSVAIAVPRCLAETLWRVLRRR